VTVLVVLLGGALGAPARYVLDAFVKARIRSTFPYGTLLVNVVGCLILGGAAAGLAHGDLGSTGYALIGTGFCGGLTTFSTFSVESVELLAGHLTRQALLYLVASCGLGIGAAAVGYAVV
jgi:CrcB protein